MVSPPYQLDEIDNDCELAGYPKSHLFTVGYGLLAGGHTDLAIDAFKRGADNVGCVPCMVLYVGIQRDRGNFYLLIPYAFEGAIRGHMRCMDQLLYCYNRSKPVMAHALASVWAKTKIELGDNQCTEEKRKEIKKDNANMCVICGKEESEDNNDVTLVQCGVCKYYSYCGKKCQTYHWQEGKHMNECRQVIILRKYCKPSYVREIREAIIGGQDPKEIHTLQRLRMKLGLNRPKEEYEELMLRLNNDDIKNNSTIKQGTKVKVKGLVKASKHNGKFGIVTKVSIPGEGGRNRVGVKLSDNSGTVLNIKIENLESSSSVTVTNRPDPFEYLIARKDGTVHIGSTTNTI